MFLEKQQKLCLCHVKPRLRELVDEALGCRVCGRIDELANKEALLYRLVACKSYLT